MRSTNLIIRNCILLLAMLSILSSCFKEEMPYEVPEKSKIKEGTYEEQVHQGENYDTEIYYSFTTGIVKTGAYNIWDLAFSCSTNEIWMNGGNRILVYPTDFTDFASITSKDGLETEGWKFDFPTGIKGESGLGVINEGNLLNKILVVDNGNNNFFKLKITEITDEAYTIEVTSIESTETTLYTLTKDDNYNFIHFSLSNGIVVPEPPKKDWDIVFTRYRHIFVGMGSNGTDMLYPVSGALLNPYKTMAVADTVIQNFNELTLEHAQSLTLLEERDVIGYDWKTVDINTGQYTVSAKKVFVLTDSKDNLWKLNFIAFYDDNGIKGSPRFRYEQLN